MSIATLARRSLRRLAVLAATVLSVGGVAGAAASYCTATYTMSSVAAGGIGFYNYFTGTVGTAFDAASANSNALAQSPTNANLYYIDRANNSVHRIDVNNNGAGRDTTASSTLSPAPAAVIVGGTTDAAGTYYVFQSNGTYGKVDINTGLVTKPSDGTSGYQSISTSGTTLTINTGGTNSDFAVDASGQVYVIFEATNNPAATPVVYNPYLWKLDTVAGIISSPVPINNAGTNWTGTVNGLAIDATTGTFLLSTATGPTSGAGGLYTVNPVTGAATLRTSLTGLTDLGSCPTLPDKPTLTKSFSPTSALATSGTTTLTLTIGNTNLAPIFLQADLVDTLPAGMVVAATPATGGTCFSLISTNTGTATAGAGTITVAANDRIPAGGCTVTVSVTATGVGSYVNTIPAGALNTTTGTNAAAASATYRLLSQPTVKVQKTSLGGVGTFNFTLSGLNNAADTVTTSASGTPVTSAQTNTGTVGTPATLTETAVPGYTTTVSCTDTNSAVTGNSTPVTSATATVNLSAAQMSGSAAWLCTFTNTRTPTVALKKLVVGGSGTNTFGFALSGLNNASDSAANVPVGTSTSASNGNNLATPGTAVSITEASASGVPLGNYTTAVSCTDANSAVTGNAAAITSATTSVSIPAANVKPGASYTCTYTNTRRSATLTLRKTWAARSYAGDAVNIPATGGYTNNTAPLASVATAAGNTTSGTAVTVYAGESGTLPGEVFTSGTAINYAAVLSCTGNGSPLSGSNGQNVNTLAVTAADTSIVCTYTNTLLAPAVTLAKLGRNLSKGTTFIDNTGTVQAGPGEVVEYCIVYRNTGGQAKNFVLSDYVPVGMVAQLNAYAAGKGVRWAAGSVVGVGGAAAPAGLDLTNAADGDQGTLDPTPVANPAEPVSNPKHPGLMTLNLGVAGAPAGTATTPATGTVCFQSKVP